MLQGTLNLTLPHILSIDTATEQTSVAALRGVEVIAARSVSAQAGHAVRLLDCVDEVLRSANLRLRDIDLLGASIGPGSFTGVRAGLATIKAFAATLNIPVAPVPTLHAVALAEGIAQRRIEALLPAGRREVFAQTLMLCDEYEIKELSKPRHTAPDVLLQQMAEAGQDALCVGAGARQYAEQISKYFDQQRHCSSGGGESRSEARVEIEWQVARASSELLSVAVARLAARAFAHSELVTGGELRSLYVRPSDAELKR